MELGAGRWALVAGATSPIGSEVALRLGEAGYSVALLGFRHPEALARLEGALERRGIAHASLRTSLHGQEGVDRALGWVEEGGMRPEVLLFLAASGVMRPIGELSMHHLGWTFGVTSFSMALLASRLKPRKLIAVSSPGAGRAVAGYGAVGAAKASMEAFLRYLALELAPATSVYGIRVGLVETPAASRLPGFPEVRERVLSATPMGRLVTPGDVAELAVVLAREPLEMLTGSILDLDGGMGLSI